MASRERLLAIVPKLTAGVGMPCNLFIIYEILGDRRKGKSNPIQRNILGMCCIDILSSSAWFLSSWAVPKGNYAYAAGNQASCNYQGFLLQLAIGAPMYNSSLAICYFLVVKHRWTEQKLQGFEKYVHSFILSFSLITAAILLPLEQYNQVGAVCYITGDRVDCGTSSLEANDIPCDRGKDGWIYGTVLFYGPLWCCIAACIFSMVCLYRHVVRTQARIRRYSVNGTSNSRLGRSGRDTSRVATQAILYSLSFIVTWAPSTLWSVGHWFNMKDTFWFDLAASLFEPLQGLWNMLIFARQRTESRRKLNNMMSWMLPCLCCQHDDTNSERPTWHMSRRASVNLWSVDATQSQRSMGSEIKNPKDALGVSSAAMDLPETAEVALSSRVDPISEESNDSDKAEDVEIGEEVVASPVP